MFFSLPGPEQVPLIEDLEQIFMRSWRESHLSEIRQFQQSQTAGTQGRHYATEVRYDKNKELRIIIRRRHTANKHCMANKKYNFLGGILH